MKTKLIYFLKLFVSLGIIFALVKLVPYSQIQKVYSSANKIYLVLGIATFFSAFIFGVLRWYFLLTSLGIPVRFISVFAAFVSGNFFNLFFPSFLASDVFRGVGITLHYGNAKKVASSVLMDRFSGGVALVSIAIVSYLSSYKLLNSPQVFYSIAFLCAGFLFLFFLIFSKKFFSIFTGILKKGSKLKEKILSFHEQLYFFRRNPKIFLRSLVYSFFVQFLTAFAFFVSSKAFGVDVGIIYFLIIVPIVMSIALIPITIAGLGLREASAVYFLSIVGIEKSIGLSLSLINLVFIVLLGIFGGIFYVSLYNRCFQPAAQNT